MLGIKKYGEVVAASESSAAACSVGGVLSSPGMKRIYIGGLGAGVTEADVEKTFAPLGRVSGVEFIRTKGRAFAYMDFEPSSDKSFAKLFATYNGCIWKGGRLRLEKAKEHYLDHLRQEWAEEAQSTHRSTVVDMSKNLSSSGRSKSIAEEKMQLRIFFPKLRKVKAVPFKGTGKHKYSFQHIAVPSLPIHFCDCEEHNQFSEEPNQDLINYQIDETVVVNEEEFSIMNSVMNKLFEKEASAGDVDSKAFSATKRDILDHSDNETQFGESEAAQQMDGDSDNLVTNIGLGNSEDVFNLMQLRGWDASSADQELVSGKRQSFPDALISEKQTIQKRQTTGPRTASGAPSSKRARLPPEKNKHEGRKLASEVAEKIRLQERESQEGNGFPEVPSLGSNCSTEDVEIKFNTTHNMATGQPNKGTSWIQKSSWKELVGDTGSSSFTISHLLPCIKPSSARLSKSDSAAILSCNAVRTAKCQAVSDSSYLQPVVGRDNVPPGQEEKSSKDGGHVGEGSLDGTPRRSRNQEPKISPTEAGVGQVCTFMRSADSEKEWTKTRAALSGYLKKKNKNKENKSFESTMVTRLADDD